MDRFSSRQQRGGARIASDPGATRETRRVESEKVGAAAIPGKNKPAVAAHWTAGAEAKAQIRQGEASFSVW
jgi:hypothetical protein